MAKFFLFLLFALAIQHCTAQNLDAERYLNLRKTIPDHPSDEYLELVRIFKDAETFPYIQGLKDNQEMYTDLANVSKNCREDFLRVVEGYYSENQAEYALQMVDSLGRQPAGVLRFNFFWMGAFQQCREVIAMDGDEELFKGKYCKSQLLRGAQFPVTVGLCFPDSCSNTDAHYLVEIAFQNSANRLIRPLSTSCIEPFPWTSQDIFALVLCGILGLCVIIGTTYDVVLVVRKEQGKKPYWERHIELYKLKTQLSNGKSEHNMANGSSIPNGTDVHLANGSTVVDDDKPRFVSTISLSDSVVSMESLEAGHSRNSFNLNQFTVQLTPEKDTKAAQTTPSKPEPPLYHRLLISFSGLTNGRKLFNLRKNPQSMDCLNGIRALSITWVILGHNYNFSASYIDNLRDWGPYMRRWTFQVILNAFFAVDTFLFLSGLLVAYGTLKLLTKAKGQINWILFYLHRYLRLTPLLAFMLLMLCTLFLHTLDGPYNDTAEATGPSVDNCYDYWWTNLIYINNFLPDRRVDQCMGWTWYLANDMQFFIISPIFLLALYKNRKVGYALLTASLLSCMLANGIMAQKYDLFAAGLATLDANEDQMKYGDYTYRRPYYRIAPYVIGMAFGDILFHVKKRKNPLKIPFVANLICLMTSVGVNLLLLYSTTEQYAERKQFDPTIGALYYATAKSGWAISLGYIVFACVTGHGGPINWLLSWRIWQPFARLSYAAYLIHPMIMYWYYMSTQSMLHSNYYTNIYFFLGHLCLSFAGGFIASVAVEAPFMRLENILFARWRI